MVKKYENGFIMDPFVRPQATPFQMLLRKQVLCSADTVADVDAIRRGNYITYVKVRGHPMVVASMALDIFQVY